MRPSNMEAGMNRMAWSGGVALVMWLALGAGSVGCGDSQAQPQTPTAGGEQGQLASNTATEEDSEDSQDLKAHHRHHHGGFAHFVFLAVDTIGITPEQKAQVDKIKADLHAKTQPVRDAQKVVLTTLADGVAAGSIDMAKVDAAIAGVTTAAGQVHGATIDVYNQLHAVLRPEQRAALVDKVEAHFLVWKESNGDEKAAAKEHEEGGHIAHLAKEIGLSNDQVEKLKASFGSSIAAHAQAHGSFNGAEAEAHMKAFGAAFTADTFDANSLTTSNAAHTSMATWGVSRMARFYEALTPVLTPEQRTKVADKLRDHANKM
jgi:Spy/CpxP family protein refolding chaperone